MCKWANTFDYQIKKIPFYSSKYDHGNAIFFYKRTRIINFLNFKYEDMELQKF
jgi:hypothetical protein